MSEFINQANKRDLEYFRSRTDGKELDHNALAFAIQALEKQVPKRAVDAYVDTVCPACRTDLFPEDLNAVEEKAGTALTAGKGLSGTNDLNLPFNIKKCI